MSRRRRLAACDSDDDRGAILVEFAIVAPMLVLVVVGVLEFGLGWRDNLSVTNAGRAGVRTVASGGDERHADYDALQAIRGAIDGIRNTQIDHVVIYESTTSDGAPSATCAAGTSSTVVGSRCNVYTAAQLTNLVPADFTGPTDCGGAPDRFYCPMTDRETDFDVGTSYVGVYVQVRRDFITGVFPGSITIKDHSVMRLDPELS